MLLRYMLGGIFLLFINYASANDFLVVSGYGIENKMMDIEENCPPQTLCPNNWFKYKIIVKESLKGDVTTGSLVGVKKQHDQFEMEPEELSIFVLQEIKDESLRKKLDSDYFIVEYSRPKLIYCFNSDLKALDLEPDDLIVSEPAGMWKQECIDSAELFESID